MNFEHLQFGRQVMQIKRWGETLGAKWINVTVQWLNRWVGVGCWILFRPARGWRRMLDLVYRWVPTI